ncbi:ABC transporter ATP-binding protein [Fulvivirga sedimenti]|uniref:ABC transporter ATP-binding protein n=1 Tax=Fulvivirga sedimenti TaxID=2879465 RepID=A0A9X1KXP7_9BACT|nr:ABC transporter ATP-binding protein [Fulvivirga sedimenti]MCA6074968.1 ABC transporter ATP-binding protein [Fulvivirga sedimenti]MCA6076145.1 ABC transporter ATP-binding protein [Fulvivirga sedimenti]MCA6077273.1 ABC transporter ATP-binding protein [Fulvivirga sedimenti]
MIKCQNILFRYPDQYFELKIPDLTVYDHEQVAVIGSSGTGKTTLLHLIAGILEPAEGSIEIDNIDLTRYGKEDRQDFRIVRIGLVFQEFELLEYLSVLDNILLPFMVNPVLRLSETSRKLAGELADSVGLSTKKQRLPGQLSQGERQRVAACRALVTQPDVLLCDEPTGNLDPANRDIVLNTLLNYSIQNKKPLVMVTHDHEILSKFSRIVNINDYSLSKL